MPSLRRILWTIPAVLALTASHASAYVRVVEEGAAEVHRVELGTHALDAKAQQTLSRGMAWKSFQSRYGQWQALWNEGTSTPHRAFGRPIPLPGFLGDAVSADRAVRAFIAGNPGTFGSPQLDLAASYRAGNVWYVRYRQLASGVPVMDADWEFRVGANGRLMMFGADHYLVPTRIVTDPRIAISVAREAAKSGIEFHPATDRVEGGDLYVLPVNHGGATDYRLVYELKVITFQPRGSWIARVDAHTGELLSRESALHHATINGNVTATVHPNLPSDAVTPKPLRNETINLGSLAVTTDSLGNYSGNVTGTVNVTAQLSGPYCNVDRCVNDNCPSGDASFLRSTASPATVNIAWSASNSQQSERDAFYHVNKAHDWVKALDPSYVGNDFPLITYTDLSDDCDAYYDFATNTLSLLAAGGSPACPNMASLPDIVYHEYGHCVNDMFYVAHGRAQGMNYASLTEGLSDVYAALMTDDPLIGDGFFGTGTYLRDISVTKVWPVDQNAVSAHANGLILAGALWDLRQSVGNPTASHIAHFALYGLPGDADDGVSFNEFFLDALVADDNNNNLSDGTPHYTQILNAFNAHGIGSNFNLHIAVTAGDEADAGPFPVTAIITYDGTVDAFDTSSPQLFYGVNGGAWNSAPMFPTGNPDEYGAQVPAQAAAVVRYYVKASTVAGGFRTVPPGAPGRYYSFIGGPYATMVSNDFETNQGWTVGASGDGATTGIWERAIPNATLIQTGQAHSGQYCYVTGNGNPGDNIAANDVDGGKTTLVSPTFNPIAGGMIKPVVSYYRWYSNNGGDNPNQDPWTVEISNNGGSSWTQVENTLETDQSWRRVMFFIKDYVTATSNMKIRFVAQDDVTFPSLVEAALDDFAVYAYPPSVDVEDPATRLSFALTPATPNPFHGSTRIAYTLSTRGHVDLSVFDIQGRVVRALLSGDQDPGRHTAAWDGKDAAGRPLPNGPYFVRLSQNGARKSEAVVVMH